ncbi:penicillin-binding protein [Dactylosporangium sp. NBC_01737]|uniref:transglycosylase domain-containing protein n=1 Tax=Dactylosporangium sp. NBC_01737 TaxID=2975959 RepID=UPI002E1409A1|nr:penicillin-binding protein [Dactylosporangium sp. NBC_01737]
MPPVPDEPVTGRASVRGAVPPPVRASARVGGPPVETPPESGRDRPAPTARAKRRRRRNIIIASLAAFIMLTGVGMVAGTYYFDQVGLPDDLTLEQSTSIYYADGPLMARIGSKNRTLVTFEEIPKHVQQAVVAAEDNTFYTNDGVDYWGVARAAWNNVTGGDRQGASTISQQYARKWADLEGVTYARKVREAVIALKLNKSYSKDQIMTMYLNIIYFGRGAHGIQAASFAYFNKPVKDLSMAEGVVLAGIIKNPSGDNEKGSPSDPTVDPVKAEARFDYIRKQMVALKFVSEAEAKEKLTMPTTVITQAQNRANNLTANTALDKPEGLAVHHVMQEVAALTDPKTGLPLYESVDPQGKKNFDKIRDGGLKIVSTLHSQIQQVAVQEASGSSKESNMFGQKPNLQAALVAVEPGTGAVKAYYGGDKGSGNDYAGYYVDPVLSDGEPNCCGGHPPGSTFKIYTLATALMAGYSINSYWNGVPQDFPGRTAAQKNQIKNATEGTIPDCKSGSGTWCTLEEITVKSLNVPFYAITLELGADRVIDTARAAGVTSMWATVEGEKLPQRQDLVKLTGKDVAPRYFGNEVGFGQYPITVLDHAGGLATFAARGMAARTHFLKEVWEKEKQTYGEVLKPQRIPGFTDGMADDLNTVLQGVPAKYKLKAAHGYQLAGKTGTWQLGNTTSQGNAHAWMGGYVPHDTAKKSPGLAAAVWVGNKGEEVAIKDKNDANIIGGSLPGPIWRDFMDGALTKVKMPKVSFLPSKGVGDKDVGSGVSPGPSTPADNPTPSPNPNPNPNPNPSPSKSGTSPSPKPSPSLSRRN